MLGGIPVHTEYWFLFFLWYEFLKYRNTIVCCLNNVWNATLFERGLFSLVHCDEDTAVCVTKCESSETEAVERDETEELIHNIHTDRQKYPLPAAISSCVSHTSVTSALDSATFRPF